MGEAKRRKDTLKRVNPEQLSYFTTPAMKMAKFVSSRKYEHLGFLRSSGAFEQWVSKTMASNGHRYLLPVEGELVDKANIVEHSTALSHYLRLPFDVTVLEFHSDEFESDTVIIAYDQLNMALLAQILTFFMLSEQTQNSYLEDLMYMTDEDLKEWICIIQFCFDTSETDSDGLALPVVVFFRRNTVRIDTDGTSLALEDGALIGRLAPDNVLEAFHMILSKATNLPGCKYREAAASMFRAGSNDIMTSVSSALHRVVDFCLFLNCSNVSYRKESVPTEITGMRIGNVPYSEFNILTVGGTPLHEIEDDDVVHVIGKPRKHHWRKGHYRTLSDGRMVWVRQCEVGSKSLGSVKTVHAV